MVKKTGLDPHGAVTLFHKAAARAMTQPSLHLILLFFLLYPRFVYNYGVNFRDVVNVDLPSFYTAGKAVFKMGLSPYITSNLKPLVDQRVWPYVYPPPSLMLFSPFSLMTYQQAKIGLLVVNHVLFFILVYVLPFCVLRAPPKTNFYGWAVCVAYVLIFQPVITTMEYGQVNIVLLTFLALFWMLARKGHAVAAGLFLALAIILKTYPVLLIPLLFLIRRHKEAIWTISWIALAALLSMVVLPPGIWHDWAVHVLPLGNYDLDVPGFNSANVFRNEGLNGFLFRTFTVHNWTDQAWLRTQLGQTITPVASGIVALGTVAAVLVAFARYGRRSLDYAMLVGLPAIFLVVPWSWRHHLVYVLPSILILLNVRSCFKDGWKFVYYTLAVIGAITINSTPFMRHQSMGVILVWLLSLIVTVSPGFSLAGHDNPLTDDRGSQ